MPPVTDANLISKYMYFKVCRAIL